MGSKKGAGSRNRRRAVSKRLAANMAPLDPKAHVPCHYCRAATVVLTDPHIPGVPYPPNMRTRDHVVPSGVGGLDKPWNIVLACLACNTARTQQPPGRPACDCHFCTTAWKLHRVVGAIPVGDVRAIRDTRLG